MFQYVNFFSYAANPESDEYFLTFGQQKPVLKADGSFDRISLEPTSELVLNAKTLEALKAVLADINTAK